MGVMKTFLAVKGLAPTGYSQYPNGFRTQETMALVATKM